MTGCFGGALKRAVFQLLDFGLYITYLISIHCPFTSSMTSGCSGSPTRINRCTCRRMTWLKSSAKRAYQFTLFPLAATPEKHSDCKLPAWVLDGFSATLLHYFSSIALKLSEVRSYNFWRNLYMRGKYPASLMKTPPQLNSGNVKAQNPSPSTASTKLWKIRLPKYILSKCIKLWWSYVPRSASATVCHHLWGWSNHCFQFAALTCLIHNHLSQ